MSKIYFVALKNFKISISRKKYGNSANVDFTSILYCSR